MEKQTKKIIDWGRVWDNSTNWKGYRVLFTDHTQKFCDNFNEFNNFEQATDEEIKRFYQEENYIFEGDIIEIIAGKKIQIGERKKVKSFFTYTPYEAYGHHATKYVVFTDGTKTNILNIKNINSKFNNTAKEFEHAWNLDGSL